MIQDLATYVNNLDVLVGNEWCCMNCTLQICQSSKWVGTTSLMFIVLLLFLVTVFPISCTLLSSCFDCCLLACMVYMR